jgi:hypothetical protein
VLQLEKLHRLGITPSELEVLGALAEGQATVVMLDLNLIQQQVLA